ncbi:EP300-interacting inhibitor of differentiation 3-like [Haliotis rubra]|uniref:EP300-interacting inhibitor of differentiation 3-like n=1 Tax=Haliotis rubra TaxID=36100 RepID=UPI001EE510B4|nr:EP300-interacting inhibitor of differentiation 3-like [Haliotis rubra]
MQRDDGGAAAMPDGSPPPDDEQDEHERRIIRRRYRQLIDEIQVNKEELANPSSDSLNNKLKEADELYKPVKKAREAALDSSVLVMIANIGRLKAQALTTEFVKFQATEFAEKLITFVSGQQLQDGQRISHNGWDRLGQAVQPCFRRVPPFHFMHGSFEPGEIHPKTKDGRRKVKEKDDIVGQATIPRQLQDFSDSDKNEATTAEVEKIHNLLIQQYDLQNNNPLCYFEFVVNPESFGQTVENMFYTSFLVRDGYAEIFLDDDKLPVIQPVGEGDVQSGASPRRQQVVISMTPQNFRDICKTFRIEAPLIPTRPMSHPLLAERGTSKGKGKGKNRSK